MLAVEAREGIPAAIVAAARVCSIKIDQGVEHRPYGHHEGPKYPGRREYIRIEPLPTPGRGADADQCHKAQCGRHMQGMGADNDVEGLCYDPKNNSLLLACKGNPGKKYKGNRAVYEFSLDRKKLNKKPKFLLPVKEIMENYKSDFTSKLGEFFLIKATS